MTQRVLVRLWGFLLSTLLALCTRVCMWSVVVVGVGGEALTTELGIWVDLDGHPNQGIHQCPHFPRIGILLLGLIFQSTDGQLGESPVLTHRLLTLRHQALCLALVQYLVAVTSFLCHSVLSGTGRRRLTETAWDKGEDDVRRTVGTQSDFREL